MSLSHFNDFEIISKKSKIFDSGQMENENVPQVHQEEGILPNSFDLDMTREQMETMARAIHNPLVLHKIISSMKFLELKLCRLINKTWKGISNEVLYKLDCCQVKMTFDETREKFRRSLENKNVVKYYPEVTWGSSHLQVFNQMLENSSDFPCSDFMFQGGDLGHYEPQTLFNLQGTKIKTLYLYRNSITSKPTFQKILLEQAPNIENLTIAGFSYLWNDPGDEIKLPLLKIFEWGYATPTAHNILSGSENLEIVKNFRNCDDVTLVTKHSKVFGIHDLDCHQNDKPETWTRLAEAGLRLHKLTFRVRDKNLALSNAYQDLLNSSRDTLKYLELSEVCERTRIRLPRLKNLSVLEMGFNSGQRIFQERINLTETFPKLKVLDCTGLLCMDDKWENYFPNPDAYRGNLPTVETLKICDDATLNWMQKLYTICPNFTKLCIQSEEDNLPQMLPQAFQLWSHLKEIQIKFSQFPENGINLDSAFTGFQVEVCDQLWALGPGHERVQGFESWRIQPSICNLKGKRVKSWSWSWKQF